MGEVYCDQFVCLCVCLSVCPRAYIWNCWTDLHKIVVQIPCGCGSVFLWRRCDMLCTSGFTYDVTFGRIGPYGDTWRLHVAATTASGMAILGRSMMSMNALLNLI